MKLHNSLYPRLLIFAAVLSGLYACSDDLDTEFVSNPMGKDAQIILNIEVPEMSIATRSDMTEGLDTQVSSLWVGIFSAADGQMTYAHFLTSAELGATSKSEHGGEFYYTLPNVETKSGASYIVAIANMSDANAPVFLYDAERPEEVQTRRQWNDLLPTTASDAQEKKFTWDTFRSIAARNSGVGSIGTPVSQLLMSGVYATAHPASSSGWEDYCEQHPVEIPATAPGESITLPGAIHLRREVSQVNFTLKTAPKIVDGQSIQLIELVPQDYTVYNVPVFSWLYERGATEGAPANAGDVLRISNSNISYTDTHLPLKANYRTSVTNSGNQYITPNSDGSFKFDFWMLENKRQGSGIDDTETTDYFAREQEYKNEENGTNTGIYTALCADATETMNNMATYVAIRCRITYTDEGLAYLKTQDETIETRTANVTYIVHLGAIDGNNDFNCRRNHKYTYNIVITDVNQIILEASEDGEPRPGFEGFVIDSTNDFIELDAHYSVFNIALTDTERQGGTNGTGKFSFRIEAYDLDGNRIIIDEESATDANAPYWQWIELRATTGENVLAPYQPPTATDPSDANTYGRTFRLSDVADLTTFPHKGTGTMVDGEDVYYYTVFVNEYVYEETDDETGNNWVKYVNRPNRNAWLNVAAEISEDGESAYLRSKYAISQHSIQTFYDTKLVTPGSQINVDAVGMEHTNESYGLTLWWSLSLSDLDLSNGQYNQWNRYINTRNNKNWSTYISATAKESINEITNRSQIEGGVPARSNLNVRQIIRYTTQAARTDDPGTRQYIEAMNACLNRNRDNNGNGVIDIEEMRWYLPSSGELVDMVIGRNSLETPLMDYASNPVMKNAGAGDNGHHFNTRFHYATSNQRILWAEEGMSTSPFPSGAIAESEWNKRPWQVRCVRALGTNLKIIEADELNPAFSVNNAESPTQIYPTYFQDGTLRDYTETLGPNPENSALNRICRFGFEFKRQQLPNRTYTYNRNTLLTNHDAWHEETNRLCETTYGTGWRLPNLKEASLIKIVLSNAEDAASMAYVTSTYRVYGIKNINPDPNGYQWYDNWEGGDRTGYYFGVSDVTAAGNINCINNNQTYSVRCVRDLQEGEFNGN